MVLVTKLVNSHINFYVKVTNFGVPGSTNAPEPPC